MTDEQRFIQVMAKMMWKHIHNWEIHFSDSLGSYGYKYFTCSCGAWEWSKTPDWSPIIDGELTPECRKWWEKELLEAWEQYLNYIVEEQFGLREKDSETKLLNAQLSWENLWKWMRENTDSWLYEPCPNFLCGDGILPVECSEGNKECNGTGKVPRWDVEKWLEGK